MTLKWSAKGFSWFDQMPPSFSKIWFLGAAQRLGSSAHLLKHCFSFRCEFGEKFLWEEKTWLSTPQCCCSIPTLPTRPTLSSQRLVHPANKNCNQHQHIVSLNDDHYKSEEGCSQFKLILLVSRLHKEAVFFLIAPLSALVICRCCLCSLFLGGVLKSNRSAVIRLPSFHNHQMTSNISCFFRQSSNICGGPSDMVTSAMSCPFPAIWRYCVSILLWCILRILK